MSHDDHVFRLSGTHAPAGEIGLSDLSAIAEALQELATRIGRDLIDQRGPGRTKAAVEALTRLRLTGLSDGSTKIHVAYGQPDVLDVDVPLEHDSEARFIEVIEGLALGKRPGWVPDLVAESVLGVLEAFKRTAQTVEFTAPGGGGALITPETAAREPWLSTRSATAEVVSISGTLEAVDLRSGRFRVRDDVGNRIPLEHVINSELVAPLINQRVRATGTSRRGSRGEVRSLEAPSVEAAPLPAAWKAGRRVDWSSELDKPGPDPDGGIELTDDEFDAFMATLRG